MSLSANTMTTAFVLAVVAAFVVRVWLSGRQAKHVTQHRAQVPDAFASAVPLAAHHKAADYTVAKLRFGLWGLCLSTAMLVAWTLLGGLQWLNQLLLTHVWPSWGGMAYQLSLLASFTVIGTVVELPLSWAETFRLEQRFGFNRMTLKLWLLDGLKGAAVGAVIGLPIAAAVLWIMGAAGPWWWLWAWVAWVAFNLVLLVLYPTVIAPWFNRFEPLKDEALAQRVQALMARCGFAAKGLFVMDGSRRSAHANAYFTGLGAAKRVVFYDTLLARLTPAEVEAVLAHELGHFKHKHVLKRMLSIFGLSLLGLAVLGWLSRQTGFYEGLGASPHALAPNDALALLLFMLVLPVFTFLLGPLMAGTSRRHEFEADAYAAQHTRGADLASALLKLYEDNASTLTPEPLYVRWNYSHPPASERLAALNALKALGAR